MSKILANDGLSAAGIEKLEQAGFTVETDKVEQDQLASYIKENDIAALLVRSATKVRKELIDEVEGQLKFIGRGGVGMDNIDVDYAREKGMVVQNTPAASTRSVAELVFAHLAGMVRFLHDSNQKMPLEGETKFKELKKAYGKGCELRGRTLGIIGAGRIGQEVARIAYGVGMNVIAYDPYVDNLDLKLEFADGQEITTRVKMVEMDELLGESDFITVHVAGAGKALLTKAEMQKMKKGSGIINTSRGGIVKEDDLLEAMEDGHIKYAGLDVFENEPKPAMRILMNEKTSLSPHIGAATQEAQERIGLEMAEHIIANLK